MGNAPHKILQGSDSDMPLSIDKPHYLKVIKNRDEMTGWERVKELFEFDDYGQMTPELASVKEVMQMSMFCGGAIGGFARSRMAYQDFFRSYAHESFESPMRGKMLLQEKVMIGFGTGFWRVGWRLTLFSGIFMFGSTCLTAYRGKQGILEYVGGGAAAGAVYKFREGPRAAIAGAAFGSGLGLIGGLCATAIFAITGVSYDTLIAFEYQRRSLINEKKMKKLHEARGDLDKAKSLSEFQASFLDESSTKDSSSSDENSSQLEVSTVTSHSENKGDKLELVEIIKKEMKII